MFNAIPQKKGQVEAGLGGPRMGIMNPSMLTAKPAISPRTTSRSSSTGDLGAFGTQSYMGAGGDPYNDYVNRVEYNKYLKGLQDQDRTAMQGYIKGLQPLESEFTSRYGQNATMTPEYLAQRGMSAPTAQAPIDFNQFNKNAYMKMNAEQFGSGFNRSYMPTKSWR